MKFHLYKLLFYLFSREWCNLHLVRTAAPSCAEQLSTVLQDLPRRCTLGHHGADLDFGVQAVWKHSGWMAHPWHLDNAKGISLHHLWARETGKILGFVCHVTKLSELSRYKLGGLVSTLLTYGCLESTWTYLNYSGVKTITLTKKSINIYFGKTRSCNYLGSLSSGCVHSWLCSWRVLVLQNIVKENEEQGGPGHPMGHHGFQVEAYIR